MPPKSARPPKKGGKKDLEAKEKVKQIICMFFSFLTELTG
jgi:hypothetical protein